METDSFYSHGDGDKLIDVKSYPIEIEGYLRDEYQSILELMKNFEGIVEVGCMMGRYLQLAREMDKKYLGIDPVSRYIDQGNLMIRQSGLDQQKFSFFHGFAENLDSISMRYCLHGKKYVLVFPFNSFGNIINPIPVLQAIKKSQLDYVVYSYRTDPATNEIRYKYYLQSGMEGLLMITENLGIRYISKNGLSSMAYYPKKLHHLFSHEDLEYHHYYLGNIGLVHSSLCQKSIIN